MRTSEDIRADVLEELEWVPGLDESEIRIAVDENIVTMTGHVPSWTEKRKSEEAAKRVAGVRGLADEVKVRVPGSHGRDDTDVVETALDALRWNYSVPNEKVTVTVDNGWLTLEGTVDWQYQRKAAERAVQGLTGMKHLSNRITVTPRVSPANVKEKVEAAFKRSAELEARNLRVATDGGTVTLSGDVHSWTEWEEAENAAWAAPGVVGVDNRLAVKDEAPVAF